MARHRRSRFITQAQQDAIVRFGPEISGLKALIAEAQAEKRSGIRSARSTARSVTSAINQATPGVAQVYREAAGTQKAAAARVQADVAGLQGLNPNVLAAIAAERASAADRTSGSQAAALTDLATQKVAARRGQQFAVQRARSDFASSVAKVLQRNTDLAREQGAFIISEAGKSRQEAAQRRQQMRELSMRLSQQERASIRSSGIDPVTGGLTQDAKTAEQALRIRQQAARQKAAAKKKPSRVPATQQLTFGNTYQQALNILRTQVDPNRNHGRGGGRAALLNGLPAVTKKTRNKDGLVETQTLAPAVKPISNPLAARVALDMYYDGHLSPETVRILRRNGIRVKALPGVNLNRKAPKPKHTAPANPNAGVFGQVLGKLGK
jgi:hypothetical protein